MKVLMVCLGNICRSPLAEGILRHKLKQRNLDVEVDSAGTAAYHTGEPPDLRSIETALKHGIDIRRQRARKFNSQDFKRFDRIYAMDRSNYADLLARATEPADQEKVDLILNLVKPGINAEVPDPYYGGRDGFSKVFQMLDQACGILVEEIAEKVKSL